MDTGHEIVCTKIWDGEVHRLKLKYIRKKCGRFSLLLVMAGIAIMLFGCGQEETVSGGVQTQETTGQVEGDDASAAGNGVTGQKMADGSDMIVEPVSGETQISAAEQSAGEQQLEMDEETRQQLTAELLEENGLDTSVMKSGRVTGGCTFDIPEGFEESEEVANLYVTARYPLDTSMIYYEVMNGDTSLQLMTEEMFKEQVEENLRQAYGDGMVIDIDSFESVKISGHPAFRILCHYEADDIKITQLEYIINADKTYAITYSQTSDIDWMEAFEASAATIKVR